LHGESRVRIEEAPCPMLAEGLRTAHAWWVSWGGMAPRPPTIESPSRGHSRNMTSQASRLLSFGRCGWSPHIDAKSAPIP
jgi:hypothetical protein